MNFGEIVEPSTRAYIQDDYENLPDSTEQPYEWSGNKDVPKDLKTLVIIESKKVLRIFSKCLTDTLEPICESKECGVKIYRIVSGSETKHSVKYLLSYEEQFQKEVCCGQVVEELSHWLENAKHIITITSAPLATYQNDAIENKFETCLRVLSTKEGLTFSHKKLESPNIISGLGAGILTYCIHTGRHCSSFIAYMDSSPVDSVNSRPLLDLAIELDLSPKLSNIKSDDVCSSNLYM